ncbi:hypothetical protein PIB30_001354 [Stylosanthes scabra]|uniref:AP2/ERF domain-containing protein n=1 Tax=Stylosanthes scabra TaxID=79078 RepID=A0ABU6Y183_9FABA|nr:hypothetical protein [Stylosanthes scabra]
MDMVMKNSKHLANNISAAADEKGADAAHHDAPNNNNNDTSSSSSSKKVYKGVRKRKWGKWVSEIRLPNSRERIWLGSYDSPEKAARAFDAALYCLRGCRAKFNFPDTPFNLQNTSAVLHRSLTHQQIQEIAATFANHHHQQPNNNNESINKADDDDAVVVVSEDQVVVDKNNEDMMMMNIDDWTFLKDLGGTSSSCADYGGSSALYSDELDKIDNHHHYSGGGELLYSSVPTFQDNVVDDDDDDPFYNPSLFLWNWSF